MSDEHALGVCELLGSSVRLSCERPRARLGEALSASICVLPAGLPPRASFFHALYSLSALAAWSDVIGVVIGSSFSTAFGDCRSVPLPECSRASDSGVHVPPFGWPFGNAPITPCEVCGPCLDRMKSCILCALRRCRWFIGFSVRTGKLCAGLLLASRAFAGVSPHGLLPCEGSTACVPFQLKSSFTPWISTP